MQLELIIPTIYNFLVPAMFIGFIFAFVARILIYLSVKSEQRFVIEFEHRVESFLLSDKRTNVGKFHQIADKILRQTHYEFYVLKAKRRLRRFDYPISIYERVFGITNGSQRLIDDTLKQTQYLGRSNNPDFERIAKSVFASNPFFSRFVGLFSKSVVDDMLYIFPSVLIICGILGTFIGIIAGLPELRSIDPSNYGGMSTVLNGFLDHMSYAMSTSVVGMLLSLAMTLLNSAMSSYSTYLDLIDRYKNSLSFIWEECLYRTTSGVSPIRSGNMNHTPPPSIPGSSARSDDHQYDDSSKAEDFDEVSEYNEFENAYDQEGGSNYSSNLPPLPESVSGDFETIRPSKFKLD